MKAWLAHPKNQVNATVVFAETRGKARSLAMQTDTCWCDGFTEIEVRRVPQMDKYYSDGKKEMDWYNPKDRIALVKECGFVCNDDCWEREDCQSCSASKYCDRSTYLYIITYLDAYGLHEHARVYAKNKKDAARIVKESVGSNITITEINEQTN